MFNNKLTQLIDSSKENQFLKEGIKISSETVSGNGAKKYSTSGDDFVDNFANISNFREPRSYDEVAQDMSVLWSQNPLLCLKLAVYIRLITRQSKIVNESVDTLSVQRGQGLKNEGIMRLLWIAVNHPKVFKANINLFISAGSWRDIIQLMSLDLQYNGWNNRVLDWDFLLSVIHGGLINPETTDLVRKYLPTIRTNGRAKTIGAQANTLIGRWLARRLFPATSKYDAYNQYRVLKSTGKAHQWQQLISNQLYSKINFDTIAGRALALLVGSDFLKNHNLIDKYTEWIMSKPVAKFTGFVFELFTPLGNGYYCNHIEKYKEATINAQFAQLVETGKKGVNNNSSLLVVRDTSSSMTRPASGCKVSSYDIAKSMALYFSEFLKGPFANSFAEFSRTCVLHTWRGETPVDKYINDRCEAYGNTDFQSVISLLIKIKQKGVSESDFPTGLLLISDGEFDRTSSNETTNFQHALDRLKDAGFSEDYVRNFKIILWDIPNNYYGNPAVKFEDFADAPNFFYMSGYDPSAVSFIMGTDTMKRTPKNAEELFMVAMDQELLNRLQVVVNKPKRKTSKKK